MKRLLVLTFLFTFGCQLQALAASTAQQVVPGYQTSSGCPSSSSGPCWSQAAIPVNSTTTESGHVLKASQGTLFGLSVTSSASGYVLVYNSATVPTNGAVTPVACYYLSSGPGTLGIAFTPFPLYMSTGISVAFSSTGCFTQTLSSTAFFDAEIF